MFEEMRQRGLTDPAYSQTQGSVKLILSGISRIAPEVEERLPRGSIETLDVLRRVGSPLGTGDLMDVTGLSRPTLIRQLNALRDAGLVVWFGKSTRDPRATWAIAA